MPASAMVKFGDRERRPDNVGILAMEMSFPSMYVSQERLEEYSKVGKGKFTVGLGQDRMAFVNDREDVYSLALSAVNNIMQKYDIDYSMIGRLQVGTETVLDHSKSVKSVLMQLFERHGNTDIEGIDSLHACYAGTDALFNSVAWVESSAWDGRFALVVVADIAEYAQGPARPTGGAGAVAMLIGPDAPIVLDSSVRASHFEHAYDFYKPNLSSPYPVVDGRLSNSCYLKALDTCYSRFTTRFQAKYATSFDLSNADFTVFHAPYNKLVQKSLARLVYNDCVRFPERPEFADVKHFALASGEDPHEDRELLKSFSDLSKPLYAEKAAPSCLVPKALGNMYTASLYAGLVSVVSSTDSSSLAGKRILMFSYGSGLASSMFSFTVRDDSDSISTIEKMKSVLNMEERLRQCHEQSPEVFAETLLLREKLHGTKSGFKPTSTTDLMFPGSFYLTQKDDKGRRFYASV